MLTQYAHQKIISLVLNSSVSNRWKRLYGHPESRVNEWVVGMMPTVSSDDEQFLVPYHTYLPLIAQLNQAYSLDLLLGAPILEAGCGLGWLTTALKFYKLNVTGVDLSSEDIHIARSVAAEVLGTSPGELCGTFMCESVTSLNNLPSNYFKLVMSNQVIEHVDDPIQACLEMYRVLAPGGILYLDCPEYRAPNEPHYCIPWIPFASLELSAAWLEGFNRPLEGLSSFKYTSLPFVLGMLQSVGFSILTCALSQASEVLCKQINLLKDYVDPSTRNPSDAYRAAKRLAQDGISFDSEQIAVVICATKN